MTILRYAKTAERPALKLWLYDDDGSLIDLSTYTCVLKIGVLGSAALLTKNTGITGQAGAGVEPTGTPNVLVTWAANELNLTVGTYTWQLTATTNSLRRVFQGDIAITDVVT